MTDLEILSLLNKPWVPGAKGPDSFDCWGLLQFVLKKYYNKTIPDAPIGDSEACKQIAQEHFTNGSWVQVQEKEDGLGVLLRGGTKPHVGIWLENAGGGVLHAMNGLGVIFSPPKDLRILQFPRIRLYKVKS